MMIEMKMMMSMNSRVEIGHADVSVMYVCM